MAWARFSCLGGGVRAFIAAWKSWKNECWAAVLHPRRCDGACRSEGRRVLISFDWGRFRGKKWFITIVMSVLLLLFMSPEGGKWGRFYQRVNLIRSYFNTSLDWFVSLLRSIDRLSDTRAHLRARTQYYRKHLVSFVLDEIFLHFFFFTKKLGLFFFCFLRLSCPFNSSSRLVLCVIISAADIWSSTWKCDSRCVITRKFPGWLAVVAEPVLQSDHNGKSVTS